MDQPQKPKNDPIRESFQKVKHDIYSLYSEISSLKRSMAEIRHEMAKISEILLQITENLPQKREKQIPELIPRDTADRQINQAFSAQNPAQNQDFDTLKTQKRQFSTGNEGVPTDRQTNQQTDNTYLSLITKLKKEPKIPSKTPIEDAAKILDSLDGLKKEIRLKFKQLTDQEILVFSTLYQLEEEKGAADYKTLANKLDLTESSIRDYIGRLLKKGIPIEKKKINNKQIQLSVSQSLKKIASLSTILQLRDL